MSEAKRESKYAKKVRSGKMMYGPSHGTMQDKYPNHVVNKPDHNHYYWGKEREYQSRRPPAFDIDL